MSNMGKGERENSSKFCYHNKSIKYLTKKCPTVLELLKIFVKENYSFNKGFGSKSRTDLPKAAKQYKQVKEHKILYKKPIE